LVLGVDLPCRLIDQAGIFVGFPSAGWRLGHDCRHLPPNVIFTGMGF